MKQPSLAKQGSDPNNSKVSDVAGINQLNSGGPATSSGKGVTGLNVEDKMLFKRKYQDLKRNAHGYQTFLSNHPTKFYVHELARSHKISEKDAREALISLGLIKAVSSLGSHTVDREYILVDSDDEEDGNEAISDDDIKAMRESMEKTCIKMEGPMQGVLQTQVENLKSEIKRLEALLRTARKKGLADERLVDELRGENVAQCQSLGALSRLTGGKFDGQQLITLLAQIGLYSSALRAQERIMREDQGADTNALAAVLTSLQSALDNAIANEQSRSLDISIPHSTTGSNSARRKRGQDDEDVHTERLITTAPTSRRSNVQGKDKGEAGQRHFIVVTRSPDMSSRPSQIPCAPSSSFRNTSGLGGPAAATLLGAWARQSTRDDNSSDDRSDAHPPQDNGSKVAAMELPAWFNDREKKDFRQRFVDLRRDIDKSREFVRNHPICDNCRRTGKACVINRVIACTSCHQKHVACPRLRAFYRHHMAGYRGMTEDEAEKAMIILGLVKTRKSVPERTDPGNATDTPADVPAPIEYIMVYSDDDENDDANEQDQVETRGVVRSMSKVSIGSTKQPKIKVEDESPEHEADIARLERLLERAKGREVELNRERLEYQREVEEKHATLTSLEEQLTLERQESERLRLQLRNSIVDSQKIINQLARHCSELRLIEEDTVRDPRNPDMSGLDGVIKSLQRIVDKAITKDKAATIDVYRFETPSAVPERRKRVRELDVVPGEEGTDETSGQDVQWVRRAEQMEVMPTRPTPSRMDRGEGPSNAKRVRTTNQGGPTTSRR
ncbi:hypothetical protein CVT26_004682 [Gymnopilus dilepis]|uniref:Uncharacterized protein n=1 Tax=Gymnopilus dilepis TaxID=231916 RepID=A0A409XZA8_9AGAR|nr:hypothetical protein CVT26_004682 [Gymnopilus dilepis]